VTAESAREFFESLAGRVSPQGARALGASYRFDIDGAGAGSWRVESDGDRLVVSESDAPADCVIRAEEKTFLRIIRGEQSPMGAYMTGKVKVEGDLGLALRLRDLLG
jgi:putative sterol carrier protein